MTVTLEVQLDPETGEHYLQFPDELIQQLGWQIGDELAWIDNGNGTWTLTRPTSTP